MTKKYNIIVTIIIIFLFIGSIAIIFLFYNQNKSSDFEYLKNYKDNEYMPVYISEEKMAKMYYNDFMYYLNADLNGAYNLLNPEYKKAKFASYSAFQSYIQPYYNGTLSSYSVVQQGNKKLFYIILSNESKIIFATSGVMNYELYFDDETISIE